MARNKRPQERQIKQDEIVAVARRLFIDEGYEATAMSRLAAAAGVAPNTIYWYFRDKDEVLVAVLNSVLLERWQEYLARPAGSLADNLLWLVRQLQETSRLVTTVHARAPLSAAVNAWHEQFHTMGEAMLREELRKGGVALERLEATVKIWIFAVEGLLVHALTAEQQKGIAEALVAGVGSSSPSP